MSKQSNGINAVRVPWVMYPLNKAQQYSYEDGNPDITVKFSQNANRLLRSNSVFLCGKMRLQARVGTGANQTKQLPANRFDLQGSNGSTDLQNHEQVAYIDHLTSVNGLMQTVSVKDSTGSSLEEADRYHRQMASLIGVMNSYKNLCSYGNMSMSSCANNDVMARELSSEVEFAIPMDGLGYLKSNSIIPLQRGFELVVRLASDAKAIYGLSGNKFTFVLRDVYLMGDMLETAQSQKGLKQQYSSYKHHLNTLQSSNDYQNIPLNKAQVNRIFHNFSPSDWGSSFNYNSYATCPILNKNANKDDYVVANIEQYNVNRGAVAYPNQFRVSEKVINKVGGFQTVRSRMYLDGISPYYKNTSCLISPVTENLTRMVAARTDWLNTPQSPDSGLVRQWQKDANGNWTRDGPVESSAHVFGIAVNLDQLGVMQYSNYKVASYNYNIESQLGVNAPQNPTDVHVFVLARTQLVTLKSGQTVAVS